MKNLKPRFPVIIFLLAVALFSCQEDENPASIEVAISAFSKTIAENPTVGTSLGSLSASTNQGTLVYSLSNQNPAGAMAIDSLTGEITVANASRFDFETNPTLTATSTASVGTVSQSSTVTITLTDVDESVDAVAVEDVTVTMNENPAPGQAIGRVTTTSASGTASFALASQTPSGALALNASTGELSVADSAKFDFETNPTLSAKVVATVGTATDTSDVTITLTDLEDGEVADNAPIAAQDFTVTIDENPAAGQVLGTVSASTTDGSSLSYRLIRLTEDPDPALNAISINSTTGELSITDSAYFDYESRTKVEANYRVISGDLSADAKIIITLNDVDESAQVTITASDFTASVAENPVSGASLGTVTASASDNSVLTYSLSSESVIGALAIDASTGELTVADVAAFDYEVNQSLTATYEATSGTLTESASITITITDVDETGWQTVGIEGFSTGITQNPKIAFNGTTPVVAFHDDAANRRARLMSYNGTQWVNKGGFASPSQADDIQLIIQNGQEVIAYRDGGTGKLTVKRLNSSQVWETLGTEGFSVGATSDINMDINNNGTLYVIYADQGLADQVVVQTYNESTNSWSPVGNTSSGTSLYADIAINGSNLPLIFYQENGTKNGIVKVHTGNLWNGAGPSLANAYFTKIDFTDNGSELAIAFTDATGDNLSVRLLSGNSWIAYVPPSGSSKITDGIANHVDLILSGSRAPIVSFIDQANGSGVTVMRWLQSQSWEVLGSKGFSGAAAYASMAISNGDIYVAYNNSSTGKVTVKKWVE
ncbi:cadherin repeat domain-containing protein [Tunicatimonas pelagia]|uniref:cadherin repeat domain-containing protein n=1 Tax=Tunicatimonas pelagia TaxID=931531 RepID=UPI0026666BBB|nr:cadherin repeat domain-containing protein [Tunicatimonas pelagia]WKN43118.1 cadherin repeat domain-containing protein [Tunicatimonas pelagia]